MQKGAVHFLQAERIGTDTQHTHARTHRNFSVQLTANCVSRELRDYNAQLVNQITEI